MPLSLWSMLAILRRCSGIHPKCLRMLTELNKSFHSWSRRKLAKPRKMKTNNSLLQLMPQISCFKKRFLFSKTTRSFWKDPASMAVAARASVILPHLLRQLDERNAKISELETSLKSRIAASPRPSSTSTPVSTNDNLPTGYDVDSIMARFQAHQRQG